MLVVSCPHLGPAASKETMKITGRKLGYQMSAEEINRKRPSKPLSMEGQTMLKLTLIQEPFLAALEKGMMRLVDGKCMVHVPITLEEPVEDSRSCANELKLLEIFMVECFNFDLTPVVRASEVDDDGPGGGTGSQSVIQGGQTSFWCLWGPPVEIKEYMKRNLVDKEMVISDDPEVQFFFTKLDHAAICWFLAGGREVDQLIDKVVIPCSQMETLQKQCHLSSHLGIFPFWTMTNVGRFEPLCETVHVKIECTFIGPSQLLTEHAAKRQCK